MTLQQLRYLCGVVEHGFSVSNAARALYTSQPGISKQIQALEQELGVEILIRHGNRIAGTTPVGAEIVDMARRTLQCAENIKRIGGDHARRDNLRLVVATTHIHEPTLVLDRHEVTLAPSDTVVQRAGRHAWSNRGTQPCVIAISSHDAQRA